MSDPFLTSGPTIINVSGGLTSGEMLRRHLDAHDGVLPDDCHAVYANTGRERHETLDFVAEMASRWGVVIHWIERTARGGFREVDYDTACRDGEPFAELITEKRYLPNAVTRFCSGSLKVETAAAFMRAKGYTHWTSVLGLRFDEPKRVMTARARDNRDWDVSCPLYDARVTKPDVGAAWAARPFTLALKSYEGNCDLCFLKGRQKRERLMREHPELAPWWAAQEARIGGRFHAHEPGYARTLDAVLRLPLLPMDLDGDADTVPCNCTDRRAPVVRCTCHRRPDEGHALACERGPLLNPSPRRRVPRAA